MWMVIIQTLVFLIACLAIIALRFNKYLWTPIFAVLLLVASVYSSVAAWVLISAWGLFFFALVIIWPAPLRKRWLTTPAYTIMQRLLPPISPTEQEALDVGDVWFESELFQGNPQWDKLLALPNPTLSKVEQKFLDKQVRTLCQMLDEWQIVEDRNLPDAVWNYIKQEGFFALCLPKKWGGHEFSAYAHAQIITSIAIYSTTAAVTVMVPNSLGPAELLLHYGSDAQKKHYLPRLAKAQEIPCFALTGEGAGSDAASMTDTGIVCEHEFEGKKTLGIRLNWSKRYITLAPIATLLGLAFKLYDPDKLLGDTLDIGITLALIPTNLPGVEIGERHNPMNMPFLNGPTKGHDVFIPMTYVIGEQEHLGQGWRMLMSCLAAGRGISLPGLANAVGQFYYRTTGAYARIREQFNLPIGKFEGVAEKLAEIGGFAYIIKACCEQAAIPVDAGLKPALLSAISKYHTTEMMRTIVRNAMDIHGGKAIQLGPRNYVAMGYFAVPIAITVEGANILTRCLLIYGQGVNRCHPYLKQEIDCLYAEQTPTVMAKFDKLLCEHIGFSLANFAKTFLAGLTGGRLLKSPKKDNTRAYFQQITRMSTALALITDVTLATVGGELKRKELMSARLGDVLSYLYLASSVLRHYHQQSDKPESEQWHMHWAVKHCLHQVQQAFDDFFANFPKPWLGKCLRSLVFPLGAAYRTGASDKISHKLSQAMLSQDPFRDNLTKCFILPQESEHILAQLEAAFSHVIESEPSMKKFKQLLRNDDLPVDKDLQKQLQYAVKNALLTQSESKQIQTAMALTQSVCAVDSGG